jgi:hypothetical protein
MALCRGQQYGRTMGQLNLTPRHVRPSKTQCQSLIKFRSDRIWSLTVLLQSVVVVLTSVDAAVKWCGATSPTGWAPCRHRVSSHYHPATNRRELSIATQSIFGKEHKLHSSFIENNANEIVKRIHYMKSEVLTAVKLPTSVV